MGLRARKILAFSVSGNYLQPARSTSPPATNAKRHQQRLCKPLCRTRPLAPLLQRSNTSCFRALKHPGAYIRSTETGQASAPAAAVEASFPARQPQRRRQLKDSSVPSSCQYGGQNRGPRL